MQYCVCRRRNTSDSQYIAEKLVLLAVDIAAFFLLILASYNSTLNTKIGRCKTVFKENAPRTLDDFLKIKYNNFGNQYKIDSGNFSAA